MFHTFPEHSMCYFPPLPKAVTFTYCYTVSAVNLRDRFGVGIGEVMCAQVGMHACWVHVHMFMCVCRAEVNPMVSSFTALHCHFGGVFSH